MQQHGPNVLILQVVSRGQWWFIVGCYIVPNDAATIERAVTSISQCPRRAALMVAGDFSTDLATLEEINHGEEIAASVATSGLEDI